MPLSDEVIAEFAQALWKAEQSRTQVKQFSLARPDMTLEDAYKVQRAWVSRKIASGRRAIGHKIGLTSRAMQRSSNINEPDFGTLLDDMQFADGTDIPVSRFIVPRVEVELAFLLKKDLQGPGCTIFDVLSATDFIVPSIEIIDARIQQVDAETGASRKVFDTISDNAANAGFVLGGSPVRPADVDLRWVGALLYRNGVIEDSGVAGAVLGHPAHGPAWLANKLAAYGEKLHAGEIILGGSFTAPLPARAGDTFHVDYNSLGAISVRFV